VLDALEGDEKTILVLGGPGAGKTTVALWAARVFLENDANRGHRVLFLTFSRAAVRQIVTKAAGVLAGVSDRIETSTFHALAYRLIRSFGRYSGYGQALPGLQSATREKLLGRAGGQLTYDVLLPGALRILGLSERIRDLVGARWPLLICDEVQDTSEEQWDLLKRLNPRRVLLLGDVNQMIYSWLPGISAERFAKIRESADREIELEPLSHRDPSGALPALAAAVMRREFDHEAVSYALETRRLTIVKDVDRGMHDELLPRLIREARSGGSRSIGIFGYSNAGVADLADLLSDARIPHVLVGIPDAHAEALSTMAALCSYAVGQASVDDVRTSLALFLTSCVRGKVPELALAFVENQALPGRLDDTLNELLVALESAGSGTVEEVASLAMQAWPRLAITSGREVWRRASSHFYRLVRPLAVEEASAKSMEGIRQIIDANRTEALLDLDLFERGQISLMNFYQTKGREADTVIHVYREDDYFGEESEPFEKLSRLLYVSISRARRKVVFILPPSPHALVEPLKHLSGGTP
jgi:DNA helicase-2/ATP-dependent DNA helicase PcrA